jgi:hypothetical protein
VDRAIGAIGAIMARLRGIRAGSAYGARCRTSHNPPVVGSSPTRVVYIRRTIKPALGSMQVRKVRGPLLDTLYARLMRCGNLACTGKPFTERRNIPDLRPDPADPRLEWQQAADRVRAAIRSGQLTSGDTLPSVPDLARLQGLKPGTGRHAFLALADEGLVHIRHGRTATIAGEPGLPPQPPDHRGHLAGRRGQGDRRGPRAQQCRLVWGLDPCGAGTGPGRAEERERPRYQGHLARLDFRARTRCSAAWNAAWPKVPSW